MSNRFLAMLTATALLVGGGLVIAQPPENEKGPKDGPNMDAKKPEPKAGPGRYTVSGAGESAVKLDTATGKTWVLHLSRDGATWIPARQIDNPQEADKYLARHAMMDREDHEREMKRHQEMLKSDLMGRGEALRREMMHRMDEFQREDDGPRPDLEQMERMWREGREQIERAGPPRKRDEDGPKKKPDADAKKKSPDGDRKK